MNNNLADQEEHFWLQQESSFLSKDPKLLIQLEDNLADSQPQNQPEAEFISDREKLENKQNSASTISTERDKKGLFNLNKNLAQVAKQLANQPDLNGLFIFGLLLDSLTQIAEPFLEAKLDKQAAGVAVINRLREIVPERFRGDSPEPFLWQDPNLGTTYQFELEGGNLIRAEGKTKLAPQHLKVRKLPSQQTIFQASSLDHHSWQIKQCNFTAAQLRSLVHAENLLPKQAEKEPKLTAEKPSFNSTNLPELMILD